MVFYFFNFFIGACLASHICVIYEHFKDKSFIWGRSHCSNCGHPLNLYQEIPILSFLALRGKCFYCKNKISFFLPCVEFLGGISLLFNNFSNLSGWINASFFFIFLLIAVFDYFEHEFPTFLLLPLFVISSSKYNLGQIAEIIYLLPITLIFILFIKQNKIGSGDLYIYLLLSLYFSPLKANYIFLLACLLIIFKYFFYSKIISKAEVEIPFIPYVYIGSVVLQFIQ